MDLAINTSPPPLILTNHFNAITISLPILDSQGFNLYSYLDKVFSEVRIQDGTIAAPHITVPATFQAFALSARTLSRNNDPS
jgi:hypothetical protein